MRHPWLAVIFALLFFVTPAPAADIARYWTGFRGFWSNLIGSVGGVVGIVLLTGAAGLFIITRGKWLK